MVRFRMSRLSSFFLGLWLIYIAACIVIRFILKTPTSSPYFWIGHAAFLLTIAFTRWMDTGKFRL